MKKIIVPAIVAVAAFAFAQTAVAKDSAKPMTAQQSKFAGCAHKSKGLKGDAHKKFMHDCLKGDTKAAQADIKAAKTADKTESKAKAADDKGQKGRG
ncbi:MAG TPA: PsiF family protein [Gammaproteobacteria bacterium]|nr:PsiF family protein [Gammaproteobacteria bacterium]